MANAYEQFITAEIREIMASMDVQSRTNPQQCSLKAMDWIEHNAADFRRNWEVSHSDAADRSWNQQ